MTKIPEPVLFWKMVDGWQNITGCWNWTGAKSHNGYGFCNIAYGTTRPHRVTYELIVGKIPAGYDIDHLCKNRLCCNPAHLEAVTRQENLHRSDNFIGENFRKTHCPKGHEYDGINSHGRRICKECQRIAARAWKKKTGYKSNR